MAIPEELERALTRFEEFYHTRYNGRKLTWLHHLSKVDVRMNGAKVADQRPATLSPCMAQAAQWCRDSQRIYDFQMTVPQLSVLLLFNDNDRVSLKDAVDVRGAARVPRTRAGRRA